MRPVITFLGVILGALAIAPIAHAAPPPVAEGTKVKPLILPQEKWQQKLSAGPKMQMTAATFFGGTGVDEFTGVAVDLQDRVIAFGNSWGGPLPASPTPTVLGADSPWKVPLHIPGMETDEKGKPLRPLDVNPNRTGFLVVYSPDLTQIQKLVRFGWGTGSLDTGLMTRDGRLVLAGTATANFKSILQSAKSSKTQPAGTGDFYGTTLYEEVINPGDVFIGQMDASLSGFQWLWILQGHLRAPARLFESPAGDIVFDCVGVKRIARDGSKLEALACKADLPFGSSRFLAGVDPVDGSILFAGVHRQDMDRDTWMAPLVDLFTPAGAHQRRIYDWQGELVKHIDLKLGTDTPITAACFLPDGRIALAGAGSGEPSVLTRNPTDLVRPVDHPGLGLTPDVEPQFLQRDEPRAVIAHLVTLDGKTWSDTAATFWCAYEGYRPRGIRVTAMAGLSEDRLAVWGDSSSWLIQTTTNHYRAEDQRVETYDANTYRPRVDKNQTTPNPPLGVGGKGPYLAIFEKRLSGLAWSSAMAGCQVQGVAEGKNALAVVSRCLQPGSIEGESNRPTTIKAVQATFGGGYSDGHIYLLLKPKAGP